MGILRQRKHLIIFISSFFVLLLLLYAFWGRSSAEETQYVTVEKGTVKDQVMAMGALMPRNIVSIKSQISGIVEHILPQEGSSIKRGDRLIEIQPTPTPREYVEARQAVETAQLAENYRLQEKNRMQSLVPNNLASKQEFDQSQEAYQVAVLNHRLAKEKLQLLEVGKADVAGKIIENTLFSPIDGSVLARNVSEGDAVVPLTENQDGTVLMTLADMNDLVFKGTVDQIDVGRINLSQAVEIQIGALPDLKLNGKVDQISLQASNFDEDLLLMGQLTADMKFKVEVLELSLPQDVTLRSGYSAVAYILVGEAKDVLLLPERVIEFSDDETFVQLQKGNKAERTAVKLGLSDGVNVEILEGLKEGDKIVDENVAS
jgi:HlyD family secretion protein